jgi:hypothetical protein
MAPENGFKKEDPHPLIKIKSEPLLHDIPMEDDDVYEDTGELTIPKTLPESWLVRVPKDLWASINSLKMDDEIRLGEVMVWSKPETHAMNKVFCQP